jgi:sulfur-oxidizing protein SoxY
MFRAVNLDPARLHLDRRLALQCLGLGGIAALGLGLGVNLPALAAEEAPAWPKDAFSQKDETHAIATLYGKPVESSDQVSLDVPEIAENGAVVPISMTTSLPNVTSISVVIPENPFPLAASYRLPEGTEPSIACRLKMAKTSDVVVVVESSGKLYGAKRPVKVTLGGCGG